MMRFRAPEDLKSLIEMSASENGRTLNAEIVFRLEKSFSDNREPWIAQTRRDVLELELVKAESKMKWLTQKWTERLATQKPIGNLEAIMYESDISSLEDSILFLRNKISEIDKGA